jgi:hypothetical protein
MLYFNGLPKHTNFSGYCLENLGAAVTVLPQRPAGRCAACKAVFDPDLEQGGNTNIVVHRDPATGDATSGLAHHRLPNELHPATGARGARSLRVIVQGSPRCATPMVARSGMVAHDEADSCARIDARRLESTMDIKAWLRRWRPRAGMAVIIARPSLDPLGLRHGKEPIGSSDLRVGAPDELAYDGASRPPRTATLTNSLGRRSAKEADVPSPRAMAAMRAPEGIPLAASTATAPANQCRGP